MFIQPIDEEDGEDPSEFNRHLQSLIEIVQRLRERTNTETLAFIMDFSTSLLTHQHHRAILQASFSQIVRLDVDLRVETFNSLILFVSSFLQLEILFISCEALRDDPNEEPLDVNLPSHLHTLHLNIAVFHGHAADELCEWLSDQTPLSSLNTFLFSIATVHQGLRRGFPSDDIDPLTYLNEETSGYEYDLSHLSLLESLSIHIPDSKMDTLAPLPQLDVILSRLTRSLESMPLTRLKKFNLIIGRNNLPVSSPWDKLDRLLSAGRFVSVQKEVFVPVSGCDSSAKMMYAQRALHLFPRCEEQDGLIVSLLERYQRTGSNMLEKDPI
ncbi:hypothetical protein VNI00_007256 [Paramarasmius palmivorus]|uniref:Uncharacterized protein n=1 Tax=Paramarasmius palmivorus TaxID=297713 RepID=A0AAW0D6C0_9AGAR